MRNHPNMMLPQNFTTDWSLEAIVRARFRARWQSGCSPGFRKAIIHACSFWCLSDHAHIYPVRLRTRGPARWLRFQPGCTAQQGSCADRPAQGSSGIGRKGRAGQNGPRCRIESGTSREQRRSHAQGFTGELALTKPERRGSAATTHPWQMATAAHATFAASEQSIRQKKFPSPPACGARQCADARSNQPAAPYLRHAVRRLSVLFPCTSFHVPTVHAPRTGGHDWVSVAPAPVSRLPGTSTVKDFTAGNYLPRNPADEMNCKRTPRAQSTWNCRLPQVWPKFALAGCQLRQGKKAKSPVAGTGLGA